MDAPTISFEGTLAQRLEQALDDHEHSRAAQLLLEAQAAVASDQRIDARSLLSLLDEHERHTEAALLGSMVWQRWPEPTVALPLARALVATGRCTEAIAILRGWDARWPDDRRAVDVTLARAYERLYLDARPNAHERRTHDLEQALLRYRACFEGRLDHPSWDGPEPPLHEAIGAVALLYHAQRRQPGRARAAALAAKVREVAFVRVADDSRLLGVAIEACLIGADPGDRLEHLLTRCATDPGLPVAMIRQTLHRLHRLWELEPTDPHGGSVLRRLQEACAARDARSSAPGPRSAHIERREARWWPFDRRKRGTHPLVGTNLHRLRFRVVTEALTRLEYKGDDEQWVGTRTYGDLFVNRVQLGLFDHILLDISGQDHRGEDISVSGWYHMDGVYHTFGPGKLGESILVAIDTRISAEDPLQIFNFQVEGHTSQGEAFSYDPVVLLAPVKGELTKTG